MDQVVARPASEHSINNTRLRGGDRTSLSLPDAAFRPFDEPWKPKISRFDEIVDLNRFDGQFSSRRVIAMPNQACCRQALGNSNHCLTKLVRGCEFQESDVGESIDPDAFSKMICVFREGFESDDSPAGPNGFCS
ncbi:MAG: hypothetical protein WA830_24495 [Candidatus Sulfotelmatobacter sp.]